MRDSPHEPLMPKEVRQRRLVELLRQPPSSDYGVAYSQVAELQELLHQEIAQRLQPAFNTQMHAMPHETYEQKKAICRWANEQLRVFHLAIRCPKTSLPGILVAGPSNKPGRGRFRIKVTTIDEGMRHTFNPVALPHFDLTPASPRREPFVEHWADIVAKKQSPRER